MRIKIYQIDSKKDTNQIKFFGTKHLQKLLGSTDVDSGIYKNVFHGDVDCQDLEDIFQLFNTERVPTHQGHSLSVSDVVEVVVYESLYRDNVEIAVHADIYDEGQTVKLNVPAPEKPSTPKTGDDRNYGFWIGLGFIAIGGAVSAIILKIKSKKDEDED